MTARITPKDVFRRSNMPSRWERLTGVSPKTAPDRKYLAFVAARYRGDRRLPHPDALVVPESVSVRYGTHLTGWMVTAISIVMVWVGATTGVIALIVAGAALMVCALVVMAIVLSYVHPAVRQFGALRLECQRARARLHADQLDRADADTIDGMITCDEGTLAYCAAKIASEIEQDPGWKPDAVGFVPIDLWDELAGIGASARQIAEDRKTTEEMERGRLRHDPDVRAAIDEGRQQRREAIALLAARVSALADYRDRVNRTGLATRRERSALDRAVRQVSDEYAKKQMR